MSVLHAHHEDTGYINVSSQHLMGLDAIKCMNIPLDHQCITNLRNQNPRTLDCAFPLWRDFDEEMTSRIVHQRPWLD